MYRERTENVLYILFQMDGILFISKKYIPDFNYILKITIPSILMICIFVRRRCNWKQIVICHVFQLTVHLLSLICKITPPSYKMYEMKCMLNNDESIKIITRKIVLHCWENIIIIIIGSK